MSKLPLDQKIAPGHTALLVIDIQKDFAAPDGWRGLKGGDLSMVPPLLEKLNPTIAVARKAGVLTLYTQQIYDRTKLNPGQLAQYDEDGKVATCDIATDGWHFHGIGTPPEADVYVKYNYNAFSNPALLERLHTQGIKTLVITGMDTQYCVETAIRNGFDHGFHIVVPQDMVACNAKHKQFHDNTLALVTRGYGVLTTADELQDIWSR